MLLTTLALLTLAVAVLLAVYLRKVPEGPLCPRCGTATRPIERRVPGGTAAWLDRWTMIRSCSACGWTGRQRTGAEPRTVKGDGRPGSIA